MNKCLKTEATPPVPTTNKQGKRRDVVVRARKEERRIKADKGGGLSPLFPWSLSSCKLHQKPKIKNPMTRREDQ
jgi:hypothetical protein